MDYLEKQVVVHVDSSDLEITGISKNVFGVLYITIGDFDFPGYGWTDFVVAVLGFWLETTCELLQDKETTISVRFMDGPYEMEFEKLDDSYLHVHLIADRRDRVVEYEDILAIKVLKYTLLEAAQIILTECHAKGWHTKDIQRLEQYWKKLNSL